MIWGVKEYMFISLGVEITILVHNFGLCVPPQCPDYRGHV